MAYWRWFSALVVSSALGSACSSGGGGSGSSGPVPLSSYPKAAAGVVCPPISRCCQEAGIPLSDSQCRATFEALIGQDLDQADPVNYTYDAELAGHCLDAARQAMATAGCGSEFGDTDLACGSVFAGKLEPGSPCTADLECAGSVGDDISCSDEGNGEVCVVERRASEGESCYYTCTDEEDSGYQFCSGSGAGERPYDIGQCFTNDGLFCSSEGSCESQAAAGQACTRSDGCAGDAHCDYASGLCAAPLSEGQSCSSNGDCGQGLFCQDSSCVPELAAGVACETSDTCRNGSCDAGICVENPPSSGDPGMALLCAILATGGF